jgi:uncharacterized protein
VSQRILVTFPNRNGLTLFGVLHPGAGQSSDLAILLLSPGVKMRVGPQRLYNRMTELFVSLGITVFRFDFYGLGDSEGSLAEPLLKDVYNHIEVGRYIADTIDAMDWLQQHHGARRFIASGLCGGAITGLLAGNQDSRIVGLLALGITPLLASRSANPGTYMTHGQLREMREWYFAKLVSPRAWARLLTFQSDYKVIWKSVTLPWRKRKAPPQPEQQASPAELDNANPLFPLAFFRMLETRRPMLLVFGGSDRLQFEFEEKFISRYRARLSSLPPKYDVHVVKDANHVLSFNEWQIEMLGVSEKWLRDNFPSDVS